MKQINNGAQQWSAITERNNGAIVSQQNQHLISYEELLGFYEMAGVDAALSDEPINRFTQEELLVQTLKPAFEVPSHKAHTSSNHAENKKAIEHLKDGPMGNATQLAKQANSIEELQAALLSFTGCTLKLTAKNTCFSAGTAGSRLMLVGDTPGREEDIQGEPFVGRSGELLNKILFSIGLQRNDVYFSNIIPWRPPGNRAPTPLEIDLCRPFIERQIELAAPHFLIALGGLATEILTNTKKGIVRARGHWTTHKTSNKTEIPLMATFHPDYLLRTPSQKKLAWSDFLDVKQRLSETDNN